jgi:hypothetical protein
MKNAFTALLLSAALGADSASAQAPALGRSVALLPPASGDLHAARLVSAGANLVAESDVSREPVSFTQALDARQALVAASPYVAESREFFREVSADELRAGVALPLTQPHALVRVHAAARELAAGRGAELALDPQRLVLRVGKTEYGAGTGMALLVDAEQLAAAGAPFVEGTTAFRIKPELGAGRIEVVAPDLTSDARHVVQVFEPQSDLALRLSTARGAYLHGDTLELEARLVAAGTRAEVAATRVQAFVTSPAGRVFPLPVVLGKDGRLSGRLTLDALVAPGPGLWELHVRFEGSVNGRALARDARTAFACSVPSARLAREVRIVQGDGLQATFGVELASAGRYEVRGILYGTDATGVLRPLAAGYSARWFEGSGALTLAFDAALLKASGLVAPFELRDVRLYDQGRMGLLQRQERALLLP